MAVSFIVLSMISYQKIKQDEKAFSNTREAIVQKKILAQLNQLQRQLEDITGSYAEWEETRQQYSDSNFYQYWRDVRVPDHDSYIPEVVHVELYDEQRGVLSDKISHAFPAQLRAGYGFYTTNESGHIYVYHKQAVSRPIAETGNYGSILIKYDLLAAMVHYFPLDEINMRTLMFDVGDGQIGSLSKLANSAWFVLKTDQPIERLITSFVHSIFYLAILVSLVSLIIVILFGFF